MRAAIFCISLAIVDLSDKEFPDHTGAIFFIIFVLFLCMDFQELFKKSK